MSRSQHLYALLKSLNREETSRLRRYFRKSGKDREQQYVRLFELILKSEAYKEGQLKSALNMEGKGTAFSVLKNYLYEEVLGYLGGEEEGRDPRARIARLERDATVLLRKKLLKQAFFKLKKALGICLKYEIFFRAAELHNQLMLLHSRAPELRIMQWLGKQDSAQELVGKANQILEIRQLRLRLSDLIRSSASQASPQLQSLSHSPEWAPIFQSQSLNSYTARFNALGFLGIYHSVMNQQEAALQARLELHRQYCEVPQLRAGALNSYAGNLFNLISSAIKQGKYQLAEELIESLRQIPGEAEPIRDEQFRTLIRFQLIHARCYLRLVAGEGETPAQLLAAIREMPRKNRVILPDYYFVVLFYGSMLSAMAGDFRAALEFIREADAGFPLIHRVDVRACLSLLEWSLRLSRGETDLLEYRGRAIRRFLSAHFPANTPETKLMDWLYFLTSEVDSEAESAGYEAAFYESLQGSDISFDRKWSLSRVAFFLKPPKR